MYISILFLCVFKKAPPPGEERDAQTPQCHPTQKMEYAYTTRDRKRRLDDAERKEDAKKPRKERMLLALNSAVLALVIAFVGSNQKEWLGPVLTCKAFYRAWMTSPLSDRLDLNLDFPANLPYSRLLAARKCVASARISNDLTASILFDEPTHVETLHLVGVTNWSILSQLLTRDSSQDSITALRITLPKTAQTSLDFFALSEWLPNLRSLEVRGGFVCDGGNFVSVGTDAHFQHLEHLVLRSCRARMWTVAIHRSMKLLSVGYQNTSHKDHRVDTLSIFSMEKGGMVDTFVYLNDTINQRDFIRWSGPSPKRVIVQHLHGLDDGARVRLLLPSHFAQEEMGVLCATGVYSIRDRIVHICIPEKTWWPDCPLDKMIAPAKVFVFEF